MSFIDLTPVASCSSSTTSDLDDKKSMNERKLQNISDFNRLIEELEFGNAEPSEKTVYVDIEDVPDTYDVDSIDDEEVEEEDIQVKYPYERKDAYENLYERIEQRLNDTGDKELEDKAKELQNLLNQKASQWKAEEMLEREQSQLRVHHNGSVFTCVICAKAFDNAEALQQHTASFHDLSGVKFKCTLCGKGYKRKKNLDSHMKLHQKEHKCEECSLVFQSIEVLTSHQRKFHSNYTEKDPGAEFIEKQCYKCKKQFPEGTLKRHMWYCENKERILEEKKKKASKSVPSSPALSVVSCASFNSYQPGPSTFRSPLSSPVVSYRDKSCQVCGETFASRQSMLRHVGRKHPELKNDPNVTAIRYVSTESPTHQYACVDCGKRLTTRAALTTHRLRAHSDRKGYPCPQCKKEYTVPSELTKHIQRVHGREGKKEVALEDLPELEDIF